MIISNAGLKSPKSSDFVLLSTSDTRDNPFNSRLKVAEKDEFWSGEVEVANLDVAQLRIYRQFIMKLKGPVNSFWFLDPVHTQLGPWPGNPRVYGANQDGTALMIQTDVTNQFLAPAGDRFQLGDSLYELTMDASTDGSGRCELEFLPDLRIVPSDTQPLTVVNPQCKCHLEKGQKPPQGTGQGLLSRFKYKFREDLR